MAAILSGKCLRSATLCFRPTKDEIVFQLVLVSSSATMITYNARILGASPTCSHYGGVDKTIYTKQAECVRETLIELRQKAGMNQRQLAAKLGRERNLVGRLEIGQRRLDVVEFYWLCKACSADPKRVIKELLRKFEDIQSGG